MHTDDELLKRWFIDAEAMLDRARALVADPKWQADYIAMLRRRTVDERDRRNGGDAASTARTDMTTKRTRRPQVGDDIPD